MKVAGIICEYNPFHNGHLRQIEAVREKYGQDTAIVAVMSGNFTQRGEPAIFDKGLRARAAVFAGVNLVLELPFPFCASGAEFFARAGVKLLDSLGVVDVLSFGIEAENADELAKAAQRLSSADFLGAFEKAKNDFPKTGHAALTERVYSELFGKENAGLLRSPNNVLAIEYLRAAREYGCDFEIHTVRRNTDYASDRPTDGRFASATAVRKKILADEPYRNFCPDAVSALFLDAVAAGDYCKGENAVSLPVLFSLLNEADADSVFGADAGLYHRLHNAARSATDLSSLIKLSETKKYTNARIRRTALFSCLGVTSSDMEKGPSFVQVLAADGVGCSLLKRMKKTAELPVLTKPADAPETVKKSKSLSDRADALYALAKTVPTGVGETLAFTPFIKK